MIILGIETSCDETAVATVENGTKILSNVIASSADLHAKTGGIIPEQAARKQISSIIPVIKESIKGIKRAVDKIDAIAVTVGPGLIGSLLVGVETAKTLSLVWKKPIIPVNHLVGHIYANWLLPIAAKGKKHKLPKFPAISLVVSGGHTDLVLIKDHGRIEWIGGTRDDAAGEAFDKTARLLGLGYPGGPVIAVKAAEFSIKNPKSDLRLFPRPMQKEDNFDWSFSGLKTAVIRKVKDKEKLPTPQLAAEIQEAIVEVLVTKTLRALKHHRPKSFLLAGGVAANKRLREKFELAISHQSLPIDFFVPSPKLCTDNAAYISSAAYFAAKRVLSWKSISANPSLTIVGQA